LRFAIGREAMSSRRTSSPAAKAKASTNDRLAALRADVEAKKERERQEELKRLQAEGSWGASIEVWWSVAFAVCVLAMQCLLDPQQGWAWPPKMDLTGKQAMSVVTSKWFAVCWAPLILGCFFCKRFFKKTGISVAERGMMLWWLSNACIFHIHCDVLSGFYQVMPALTQIYSHMSPQHKDPQWSDSRLHLDTVYFMELFFEAPFAVLVLFLYVKRSPARHLMEIFALAVQFSGTVIYYVPRFIRMETMPSWICFLDSGFGFVWIAFPVFVLSRHWKAAVKDAEKKTA